MFKVLVPAVALLGLAAFAARTETPAVDTTAQVAPMAWHLSKEGDMAKLAYGVANSDQLSLMMTCAPGDRAAVVYGDVKPDSPNVIPASYGPTELDPMTGELETRIALNDVALRRFVANGRLRVKGEAGKFDLPADQGELRLVSSFLAHCTSGRA